MKQFMRFMFLLSVIINFSILEDSLPYRNVMYYADWSIYNGQRNFYPSQIDANLISHLIFAYLDMDSNGDLVLFDEFADFQIITLPEFEDGIKYGEPFGGVIGAISILKVKYPHLKIGISVGGIKNYKNLSEVARDKLKRQNFASSIARFINHLGYDFVDIDWRYPETIKEEDPDYAENFILLLKEVRNQLNTFEKNGIRYELSATMPISPIMLEEIEFDKVLQTVSFSNMKTYDLNGDWNSYTAHHTPLYTNEAYNPDTMPEAQFSIDSFISYLENKYGNTIDMKKIIIGVAPYTRGWGGVKDDGLDKDNPGLYATANSSSVKGADGTISGIYGFHEIPTLIKQYDLLEYFDNTAKAAYYYSPNNGYFFSCDNEESVAAKGKYVKEKELGGLVSWMASYDQENIIAKAMFNSLYEEGYTFPERELKYNLVSISCSIQTTENGYTIRIQNNGATDETNNALLKAQLFRAYILNLKIFIKSKSGAVFGEGPMSGTVINKDGEAIIDPSSHPESRVILPFWNGYTFTVTVSGIPNKDDIESVSVSQRILPSLRDIKRRVIYYNK